MGYRSNAGVKIKMSDLLYAHIHSVHVREGTINYFSLPQQVHNFKDNTVCSFKIVFKHSEIIILIVTIPYRPIIIQVSFEFPKPNCNTKLLINNIYILEEI